MNHVKIKCAARAHDSLTISKLTDDDVWFDAKQGRSDTAIKLTRHTAGVVIETLVAFYPDLKLSAQPIALPAMWVGADAFPEDAR